LCVFCPPKPIDFSLLPQFPSGLPEENSCHTEDNRAKFNRCLPNMSIVSCMTICFIVRVWKFFSFSWAFFISPLNLLASLSCTCYNIAHKKDNCANVGLKLDGMWVFRIDRLRRDRKHFLEPCVTFC
jgi:hypothetical protein